MIEGDHYICRNYCNKIYQKDLDYETSDFMKSKNQVASKFSCLFNNLVLRYSFNIEKEIFVQIPMIIDTNVILSKYSFIIGDHSLAYVILKDYIKWDDILDITFLEIEDKKYNILILDYFEQTLITGKGVARLLC